GVLPLGGELPRRSPLDHFHGNRHRRPGPAPGGDLLGRLLLALPHETGEGGFDECFGDGFDDVNQLEIGAETFGNKTRPVGNPSAYGGELDPRYNPLRSGIRHCVRTLTRGSVERPRNGQSLVEPTEILLPAHDHCTERFQVAGEPLHVDETATALVHYHDEMDQGDFGCIPGAVEHGLSGEETADGDAVEPA